MTADSKDTKGKKGSEDAKVGVYICHCGGNISDTVDVEELEKRAGELPGVSVVRRNMFMCSDPGQDLIIEDLKSGEANRIVVASCAPHLHETTFRGCAVRGEMNPYLYEQANIREQVSWVHHGEEATNKATALVGAAVAKARQLKPLEPIRMDAVDHTTVIGGGVAGLKAAREMALRGLKVTLVEKTPFLGGNFAQLDRVFPTEEKAGELLTGLAREVLENPSIEVLTCAELVGSDGYVGNFVVKVKRCPPGDDVDLERLEQVKKAGAGTTDFVPFVGILPSAPPDEPEEREITTGAIVLATGFRHYTPHQGEYGYGDNAEVITLPDLIKVLAEDDESDDGVMRVNGRPIHSMAMIRCVGSRQIDGINEPDENDNINEWCSRVCCTATLQADRDIKARYPETQIYDLYRDIRTYGRGHEEYYVGASRDGVLFVRFEPENAPQVSRADDGEEQPLKVVVKDAYLSGKEMEIPVDLVVLAVGMERSNITPLIELMKLPTSADRYLQEVHPKLRPVEMATTGVLLAGTCQAPMDASEAAEAAGAAAVKTASLLSRGYVELDPFVAEVNTDLCEGTGACVEECPQAGCITLAAINGGKKQASVNPALCTGCGMCVAVCPNVAIDVNGWSLRQYESMVDAIVEHAGVAEGM